MVFVSRDESSLERFQSETQGYFSSCIEKEPGGITFDLQHFRERRDKLNRENNARKYANTKIQEFLDRKGLWNTQ